MRRSVEVHVTDDQVVVRQGRSKLVTATLTDVVREIRCSAHRAPSCGILPRGVRVWLERDNVIAVVIEVPPHARTVRWIAADSRAAFGPRARYVEYFIAFPYVELLVVFRDGALTGFQQLYYRRSALGSDESLLLPNLYNVAQGYRQQCWVCLANLRNLGPLSWSDKVDAVVEHVFTAAFNRSSEMHEGNSWWGAMKDLDPRVGSPEAWQEATRSNPHFILEVPWHSAATTVTQELTTMLDHVVTPPTLHCATDLAGIVTRARAGANGREP